MSTTPPKYTEAQVAAFSTKLAPFRGQVRVDADGTLHSCKDGVRIPLDGTCSLFYALQMCALDVAKTFLFNLVGQYQNIGIKYDTREGLDEKGTPVKEFHVLLDGTLVRPPPNKSDFRFIIADFHSTACYEDALVRLALLYQDAINNWVSYWTGPTESKGWFDKQLACHNQLVVFPASRIVWEAPVLESVMVPSGREDASKPINGPRINPTLPAQSVPAEESVAGHSSNNSAPDAMSHEDMCLDLALFEGLAADPMPFDLPFDPALWALDPPAAENVAHLNSQETAAAAMPFEIPIDPALWAVSPQAQESVPVRSSGGDAATGMRMVDFLLDPKLR